MEDYLNSFYVQAGECIACGAPEQEAPALMSHQPSDGQCFFLRQPANEDEVDQAILAVQVSCCGAVRYGGNDVRILSRLAELGCADQCDFRLTDEPLPVSINIVSFSFMAAESGSDAKQILESIAADLLVHGVPGAVREIDAAEDGGALRYAWALKSRRSHAIQFHLQRFAKQDWGLWLDRRDGFRTTGFAIRLYQMMARDDRFLRARWFAEEEWRADPSKGRLKPW